MATILFTYEFGAGFGHLNRLIAVARQVAEGNRIVFALPDLKGGGPAAVRRVFGNKAEICQGVSWSPTEDAAKAREIVTHTLADVTRLFAFHDADQLLRAARGWVRILREFSPKLIVADFAPSIRLVAARRIPSVVIGSGYTIPPGGRPLPPIRPWQNVVPAESRMYESEMLVAANRIRSKLPGAAVDHFADLFQGDDTFVCSIAEFDPYRAQRSAPPAWPFNVPTIPRRKPGHEIAEPHVFCYFQRAHPALRAVLGALNLLGSRVRLYVRDLDARELAKYCAKTVLIHAGPADFATVLPNATVLLHYGGMGTTYAGLMAGVPQLVLPNNLEQAVTARGLQGFGSGLVFNPKPEPESETLRDGIRRLTDEPAWQANAVTAAERIEQRRDDSSVERVAAACRARL